MYIEHLKLIRKELNLTVEELSQKLGIPARTIGGYERAERKMSLETVTQLCRKLNVNANWFVTGEGEMFLSKPVSAAGKIKEIQKRSCLTDAQAAQLLNVSIEEYTQAVSGEKQPDVHLLKNLKKCFNVSIDWLLSD